MEEYVPKPTPIKRAMEKYLIDSPPNSIIVNKTKITVAEVLIDRAKVSLIDLLTIFSKFSLEFDLIRFSLIRS